MAIEEEMVVDKVRLPEKVSCVCDSCKHNTDMPLMLEPTTLMALDQLVEVV